MTISTSTPTLSAQELSNLTGFFMEVKRVTQGDYRTEYLPVQAFSKKDPSILQEIINTHSEELQGLADSQGGATYIMTLCNYMEEDEAQNLQGLLL